MIIRHRNNRQTGHRPEQSLPRFIRQSVPRVVFSKQGITALGTVQLHNDGLDYLNYGALCVASGAPGWICPHGLTGNSLQTFTYQNGVSPG